MISTILTYPKILTYDNLPDRGLLLGKTSTQTVSIIDFLIDNIQLPAHFKMLVKPNENRSIITKKFSPIFGQKESTRNSAIGWDPADTKEYLSDIIRVKSGELNVMKFKNSSGNINCSAFHRGERNYVKYIKDIENLSLLHRVDSVGGLRYEIFLLVKSFPTFSTVNTTFCSSKKILFSGKKRCFCL